MSQTDCMESFAEYHFIKRKVIFCGCNMDIPASRFGKKTFSRGDRFLFVPYNCLIKKIFNKLGANINIFKDTNQFTSDYYFYMKNKNYQDFRYLQPLIIHCMQ